MPSRRLARPVAGDVVAMFNMARVRCIACGAFGREATESLLFACPKRSNQEKGHPRGRAFRAPALQVRRRATGFFDSTSCADEKLARIPASHPAGFPPPTCRALWGSLAHIRLRTRCQRFALVGRRRSIRSYTAQHVTVTAVMPAKAGIHGALMPKAKMDARFRGHDGHEGN